MPVAAYIAIGTIITVWKLIVTLGHCYLYRLRTKTNKDKPSKRKQRKVSFTPILSVAMLVIYIVFFSLTGLNVANVGNGWSAFLFGLGWLTFGLSSVVFLLKFVRLGYLIVPSRARRFAQISGEKVDVLDFKGRVSLGLALFALLCQAFLLCVCAVIWPNDYTILQIAFGFHAWFSVQHGMSIVFQFENVKRAYVIYFTGSV